MLNLRRFVTVLVLLAVLTGCGNQETGKTQAGPSPSPSLLPSAQPTVQPTAQPTIQPSLQPTVQPTVELTVQPILQGSPTPIVVGPFFDPALDLRVGPLEVPLELQIPALKVDAPVLGVGLTKENVMDAPTGQINDPIWNTAFWYRGSNIPGEVGTATIAGHVNDPFGIPKIFAHLGDLQPGDLIIVHVKNTPLDIRFAVDQVKVYTLQESSSPAVLKQIFGAGPVSGTRPQPSPDGLAHLTLITCAGNFANGEFDHHTVVYATLSK
jgi:sortase (surface protein transpeptidase)